MGREAELKVGHEGHIRQGECDCSPLPGAQSRVRGLERIGDLELNENLRFQKRESKAPKAGSILFVLIIIAALAGLFGAGPLSIFFCCSS